MCIETIPSVNIQHDNITYNCQCHSSNTKKSFSNKHASSKEVVVQQTGPLTPDDTPRTSSSDDTEHVSIVSTALTTMPTPIPSPHIHPMSNRHSQTDSIETSLAELNIKEATTAPKDDVLPASQYTLPNQYNLNKPIQNKIHRLCLEDFSILQTVGTGSFARVHLAKSKATGRFYAIKAINKKELVTKRQVEHAHNERHILGHIAHPFIVKLWGTFQTENHVFLVMDYVPGGELFRQIRKNHGFTEEHAKFYAAEVILAIEYLHQQDIAYRDLKPENILIDRQGHVKLTDFGFAKVVPARTWTVCGTPDYIAPEIIRAQGYTKAVDWWSLGVLIYEMLAGNPPFTAVNPIDQYQKILECDLTWPETMSMEARDLIQHLLRIDPSERFGNLIHGTQDIKDHVWFKSLPSFQEIANCHVTPPFIPDIQFDGDTHCFPHYKEVELSYQIPTNKIYCDHFAYF